jgi:transposase
MAELGRKTKRYPSDLTDEEWARIEPLLPKPSRRGRKPAVDLREVLNAIRYMARSAGGWRMLPVHFGPWQAVYWWFRRFVRRLLFRTIHDVALMLDREAAGREGSPTGGVLDSQTVKAPFAEARGVDGGKRIVGRKRHIAVDTDGRLLMVNLTPADVSDSAGAQTILGAIRTRWPWLKHLFADAGYDRTKLMDKAAFLDFVVEIVRRSDKAMGFEVIPRRWVVERTFGWMIRWRRLVRDYEKRVDVSEAMIHVAMGALLLRRVARRGFSNARLTAAPRHATRPAWAKGDPAKVRFARLGCYATTCRCCDRVPARPRTTPPGAFASSAAAGKPRTWLAKAAANFAAKISPKEVAYSHARPPGVKPLTDGSSRLLNGPLAAWPGHGAGPLRKGTRWG